MQTKYGFFKPWNLSHFYLIKLMIKCLLEDKVIETVPAEFMVLAEYLEDKYPAHEKSPDLYSGEPIGQEFDKTMDGLYFDLSSLYENSIMQKRSGFGKTWKTHGF